MKTAKQNRMEIIALALAPVGVVAILYWAGQAMGWVK